MDFRGDLAPKFCTFLPIGEIFGFTSTLVGIGDLQTAERERETWRGFWAVLIFTDVAFTDTCRGLCALLMEVALRMGWKWEREFRRAGSFREDLLIRRFMGFWAGRREGMDGDLEGRRMLLWERVRSLGRVVGFGCSTKLLLFSSAKHSIIGECIR